VSIRRCGRLLLKCPGMIDPVSMNALKLELRERMLDTLRDELRAGLGETRRIMPRQTTAISLVGTDGGNNRVEFDPFMAQLVRVVDSSNNEYCLEVITPTSDLAALSERHMASTGSPSALGRMMKYLGVSTVWDLSPMIKRPPALSSPSWVQVYRELTEWAVLFSLVREKDYGTDTVIVWDGLLRSKVFTGTLFSKLRTGIIEAIEDQKARKRRSIHVVGVAKHSKVLQRYRLAMALEGCMRHEYPCFTEVSRELEQKAYVWSIDMLDSQTNDKQVVFGSLLSDAIEGFPVPFYPRCLQRAHENAALVDFDMDILQQGIVNAIREALGDRAPVLDELQLIDADPASKRYG
jgi:hypothetical protein